MAKWSKTKEEEKKVTIHELPEKMHTEKARAGCRGVGEWQT